MSNVVNAFVYQGAAKQQSLGSRGLFASMAIDAKRPCDVRDATVNQPKIARVGIFVAIAAAHLPVVLDGTSV